MLSNILKIGVGIICIYFMSLDNNGLVVGAEGPTQMVFNQQDLTSQYELLFENLKNQGVIRSDSELLGVSKINDEIIINVNESFIYIGGTYREREVINKFVKIGLSEPNIKYVTILVNGEISDTSEGISIYKLSEPYELD